MAIIGDARSIGKGEDYSYDLDDRQELVKTISGAVAVDPWNGHRIDTGDIVSFSAEYDNANATTVIGYWTNRQRVRVVLDDNSVIDNARIIVRKISLIDGFYKTHKRLGIEVWRV